MNRDFIQSFIGKIVQVKIEGFAIYGKLCSFYSFCDCNILLLQSDSGFTLLKGNFESIGETKHV